MRKTFMMKNPNLTVVNKPASTVTPPPATLGAAGATLWRSIISEYKIDDSGGLAMLAQICAAEDRATECAAAIAVDGTTIATKRGIREHPLLKHELAARSFVVRSLHRLGLDIEPKRSVGRPSGTFNRG
jgi:terminase small subunit-like protein